MPFEIQDLNEPKQASSAPNLDLARVHAEKPQSTNASEQRHSSNGDMPTGRLVGLAGTTAGLTELAIDKIGNNTAKLLHETSAELMTSTRGGSGLYNSLDKLRTYQTTSLANDINTAAGPLSAATNSKVGHLINHSQYVVDGLRERSYSASLLKDSSAKLTAEIATMRGQFDLLAANAGNRAQIAELIGHDMRTLRWNPPKDMYKAVNSQDLQIFAEVNFRPGSLFREEMIKHASGMAVVKDTITPKEVIAKIAPAWEAQRAALVAEQAQHDLLYSKLAALGKPNGIIKDATLNGGLFKDGEPILKAIDDNVANTRYVNAVEARLSANQKLLYQHASGLNAEMAEELGKSGARSFTSGFAKGALAMTAAIGAGYVFDKITEREHLSISSPLGMGIDAAAGLTLLSKLPMQVKVPLAVATFAAPRLLDATGHGDMLRPSMLQGNSEWRPNTVDAVGIGLAAGLNVDGRIRLGILAATFVAGRIYGAANSPKNNDLLDFSEYTRR